MVRALILVADDVRLSLVARASYRPAGRGLLLPVQHGRANRIPSFSDLYPKFLSVLFLFISS